MRITPHKLFVTALCLAALCFVVEGRTICRNVTWISSPAANVDELCFVVGQPVTLRGRFSLRGKTGPFVMIGDTGVYLIPKGSFSWGKSYGSMEGKVVTVTGTLRFYKAPPDPEDPPGQARARPPDHYYYMEAENAGVELAK